MHVSLIFVAKSQTLSLLRKEPINKVVYAREKAGGEGEQI